MKYSDVKGVRPKGNGFEMYCYNLAKKKVFETWYPDPAKTESQNAEELQKARLLWKTAMQGKLQQQDRLFKDVAADYMRDLEIQERAEETLNRYRDCEPRVMAEFGDCPIRQIQAYQIQRFIDRLLTITRKKTYPKNLPYRNNPHNDEPLGWKSVNSHLIYISGIFGYAERFDMVVSNPCRKVQMRKKPEPKLEIYSPSEIEQILNALYTEANADNAQWRHKFLYYFILAAFNIGGRSGEIFALTQADIENRRVKITKQLGRGKNAQDKATKTHKARVIADIPHDFYEELTNFIKYREEYAEPLKKAGLWGNTEKIFCSEKGKPICHTLPRKWFENFCTRHGLRYVKPHGCRHLNVSLRIRNGEDIASIAAKSGHSKEVMLHHYAHFMEDEKDVKPSEALSIFNRRSTANSGNLVEN